MSYNLESVPIWVNGLNYFNPTDGDVVMAEAVSVKPMVKVDLRDVVIFYLEPKGGRAKFMAKRMMGRMESKQIVLLMDTESLVFR